MHLVVFMSKSTLQLQPLDQMTLPARRGGRATALGIMVGPVKSKLVICIFLCFYVLIHITYFHTIWISFSIIFSYYWCWQPIKKTHPLVQKWDSLRGPCNSMLLNENKSTNSLDCVRVCLWFTKRCAVWKLRQQI